MTSWKNNNTLESRRLVEEVLDSPKKTRKVVASDKKHLKELIEERIDEFGYNCDLNDIDVSQITNMSNLFRGSNFNGDISNWDVSNVTDMRWMFQNSKFSGDISGWDVTSLDRKKGMFLKSPLAGKEPSWYKNA